MSILYMKFVKIKINKILSKIVEEFGRM